MLLHCGKCGEDKPESEYNKHVHQCKKCYSVYRKKYYSEHLKNNLDFIQRRSQYMKEYYLRTKEKRSDYQKKYYLNHLSEISRYHKEYEKLHREDNREKTNERSRQYKKNIKWKKYDKQYRENNIKSLYNRFSHKCEIYNLQTCGETEKPIILFLLTIKKDKKLLKECQKNESSDTTK
jgi:hypothetical protein